MHKLLIDKALKKLATKSTSFDLNQALIRYILEHHPETGEPKIGNIVYFKTKTLKNREMIDVYIGSKVKSLVFDTKSNYKFFKLTGEDGQTYVLEFNKPANKRTSYESVKEYFIREEETINDPERWSF